MEDKPASLQKLFRRALTAQVELGMGEMIVNMEGRRSHKAGQTADEGKMVRETERSLDLFAPLNQPNQAPPLNQAPPAPQFESLKAHFEAISDCQLCPLGQTRTKLVYGVGSPESDLIFIGEAPGRDEDIQGEPFVGRAGQLFDRILAAIGLSREEVYIANILKCRPPNNRDPQPEEMDKCYLHLQQQIRIIRPRLICALGRVAGQMLLKTNTPLGKLRGRWHDYEGVPMLVTYHPAALLRNPAYKKDTWNDMRILKESYDKLT